MSSSPLAKRKADDYSDDAVVSVKSTAIRKDHFALPSSFPTRPLPRSPPTDALSRLHFFVRTLSDHTLVLHADPHDSIRTIHEKIHSITRIPVDVQRLIYRGKQLQLEQTLAEAGVQNDAGLHLVGRMRSTRHPQACQLIDDVVSYILYLYKQNPLSPPGLAVTPRKTVRSMLLEFLAMTPRFDTEFIQASDHLQVFGTSSAPSALVMLYMSSFKPNRDLADDAIKHFINSFKTVLPKHCYHERVPIVLDFCKLLSRAAGVGDPLYGFCRSSLGTMVQCIDFGENEGSVRLPDVFPFFSELAAKLSNDLVVSTESASFLAVPSMADVNDFTLFFNSVKNWIKRDTGLCGPIRISLREELCSLPLCYEDEIINLQRIFFDLLNKLDKCLVKIESRVEQAKKQVGDIIFLGSQFLALLKELNSISKLYHGCEEVFWDSMKKRKGALCYLIVRCAKRGDDHNWISECKEVTNFEARRHLAMMLIPEVKGDYDEQHEMLIDRANLLAESFAYIRNAGLESLRAGLFMEFKNEEATGPGVLREWFFLVCQAIFNPQNPLFVACPNDHRRFFPNPASAVDPLDGKYFNFVGKVIALALMHKVQVGIIFDRVFFLQLAGHAITLEDIRDADPFLYRSCKQILEMDAEAVDQDVLGLTFVHEIEELGTRRLIELCPDGKSVVVNSKNRRQYVDSLIHHRFVKETSEQVEHFAKGFADILSCRELQKSFFRCLNPEDFDLMIHGSENEISVDDWKAHTEYNGFNATDVQILWFWKVVGNMTKEQKKVLLFFWTSIKYLPSEGFSGLASRLYIYKNSYTSLSGMLDRLRIITQEHVSCSFGTW
ncbi:hypothetical protein CASFOL_014149 [Castilleja foliolosa]|uniref:HECT-type E3 ubiquitin transferase n=1 Tax=Castilleja foliolosa TaxID=1961234 RepID=A0ABD3DN69_9LAMI